MYRQFTKNIEKKIKKCKKCGKEFVPASHGGTKEFCSYRCSNEFKWIARKEKIAQKKPVTKCCVKCGIEYNKHPKMSLSQWNENKFCSIQCASASKKINDGMTTHERLRRKRGQVKSGTPEWLEKIKAKTKEGMYRPDVQEKIRKSKGPMTEENKIIRSDALVGMLPKNMSFGNNGSFPHVQRGEYECSKGSVYFRSKWEANYALYLDFLIEQGEILNWEYEAETFFFEKIKLGTRSYRPDFKIYNPDGSAEYHEVKGYMDARSKTKLKRMEKYFPEVKLILIDRAYYTDILKKLKGVIKFY